MRACTLLLCVGAAIATPTLRASSGRSAQQETPSRRLWGGAAAAKVMRSVHAAAAPENARWDRKDKHDDDHKLAKPFAHGGDFFFRKFFVPRHGFKSPVGEQATCIVDKVAHLLSLAFCGAPLSLAHGKRLRKDAKAAHVAHSHRASGMVATLGMGCDAHLFSDLGAALGRCCTGEWAVRHGHGKTAKKREKREAHARADWRKMTRCSKWVTPLAAHVTEHVAPAYDRCRKALHAIRQTKPLDAAPPAGSGQQQLGYPVSPAQRHACDEFGSLAEGLYTGSNDMLTIAKKLYRTAHKLDLTKRTKKFMEKCTGVASGGGAAGVHDDYSKKCRLTLAKMWKVQTGSMPSE